MDNEEPIITNAADLTEEQKREIIREYTNAKLGDNRVSFSPERAREAGRKGSHEDKVRAGRLGGLTGKGGKIGGKSKSEAKQAASRENGKKGGRPRKPDNELKRPRRPPKQTPPQEPPPVPFVPDI